MTQAESLAGEPREAISSSFATKLFYVFAVLALLSLGISVGGKWLGRSIALAGHSDDTTRREIVIGNNVLLVPANMIRFDRQRRDGVAERLDLYLRWPGLDGYSDAARDDFNHARGSRNIVFLSLEERIMSRDMSGRLEPIYAPMLKRPGKPGPGGVTLYADIWTRSWPSPPAGPANPSLRAAWSRNAPPNRWRPASATSTSATISACPTAFRASFSATGKGSTRRSAPRFRRCSGSTPDADRPGCVRAQSRSTSRIAIWKL
jgi:hypothetical protein